MLAKTGDIQVASIAIKNDTIHGISANMRVYKHVLSTMSTSSSWILATAGDVMSIAIKDDTVYGIGSNMGI